MRISPLGILGHKLDLETLKHYVDLDCKLTNPHPVAIDAVYVYTLAIKELLRSGNKCKAFDLALAKCQTKVIKTCLCMAKTTGAVVPLSDGRKAAIDGNTAGYLGIALQNAFYELLNGKDFYSSLCRVILRGGDTDTNGCIVGALLGAYYGEDQMPTKWKNTVAACNNPRKGAYPEIDQRYIDAMINVSCKLIKDED